MLNIQAEIASLQGDIRRVVSKVLRSSRYFTEDHIEECTQEVIARALIDGAKSFDESRGSAKSHFTTFARCQAINWLGVAHRRFESVQVDSDTDDESAGFVLRDDDNPFAVLVRKQEAARMRRAIEALRPRYRALVDAFLDKGCWYKAAREIGVSQATASRMKVKIVARLR